MRTGDPDDGTSCSRSYACDTPFTHGMVPTRASSLLIASLLAGCASTQGTGADAGHTRDAAHDAASAVMDARQRADSAVTDARPSRDARHAPDAALADAKPSLEAGRFADSATVDAGRPCPMAVPMTPTKCPLPGYGCQYESEDGGQTQ